MELLLASNDKFLFITVPKNASRFINRLCPNSMVFTNFENFSKKRVYRFDDRDGSSLADITIQDFDDFLNKKIKKNVVMIYRDPQERLITGIGQDFKDIFKTNYSLHTVYCRMLLSEVTSKYTNGNSILKKMYLDNQYDSNIENMSDEEIQIYNVLMKKYIKELFTLSEFSSHTENYLFLYYTLLTMNIDTNKVILCDMDEDKLLNNMLSDFGFEIEPYRDKNDSNEFFKNLIRDIKNKDKTIQKNIHIKVREEQFFYGMLKNHKSNFTYEIQD